MANYDCKKLGPPFGSYGGARCGECEEPIRKLPATGVPVHEKPSATDLKNIQIDNEVAAKRAAKRKANGNGY